MIQTPFYVVAPAILVVLPGMLSKSIQLKVVHYVGEGIARNHPAEIKHPSNPTNEAHQPAES